MSHIDDSHELWTHIHKRFGVKNGQRVQQLKTDLPNCRQKGVAIETYYGKLSQLWRSLADYQKAKTMEEVRKEREEDKLHQFLMGLDETMYGAVKSSLLSWVPLPTLEEAYNTLIQDEESKLLGRMNEERNDAASFAVQTSSRPRSSNENRGSYDNRGCSNCGRKGHTSENCFRLIGYPEWYEKNKRTEWDLLVEILLPVLVAVQLGSKLLHTGEVMVLVENLLNRITLLLNQIMFLLLALSHLL